MINGVKRGETKPGNEFEWYYIMRNNQPRIRMDNIPIQPFIHLDLTIRSISIANKMLPYTFGTIPNLKMTIIQYNTMHIHNGISIRSFSAIDIHQSQRTFSMTLVFMARAKVLENEKTTRITGEFGLKNDCIIL